MYAYSLPTFDLLKKPAYQDALISVGMKPLLDSLPWGVDLKACVDFSTTYNKKARMGTLNLSDGTQHEITITEQLLEKTIGMKMDKWSALSIQVLKQKGVLKNTAKDHIRYSDVLREDLATTLPVLKLLSMVTFSEVQHRVTAMGITCLLEQDIGFPLHLDPADGGPQKDHPNFGQPPTTHARLLYTAAEIPMLDPATTTEANLLSTMLKSSIVGDEAIVKTINKDRGSSRPPTVPATVSEPEPSIQAQQSASVQEAGESSDLAGTSDQGLQIVGVSLHEAEHFNIQQLLYPTPINCKRHHEASTYFEGFSQKLQRLSTKPPPNIPNDEEEGVEEILTDTAGTVVLVAHLVMEQSMKRIENLIAKKAKVVEASYEAQLQQLRTESAALQENLVQKDAQPEKYEATLTSMEENFSKERDIFFTSMVHIQQEKKESQALCDEEKYNCLQVIEECKAIEAELHEKNTAMKALAKTIKAKTQEISALKAMDPSERSMLEVEKANKRVTIVFNALDSIGQDICKSR